MLESQFKGLKKINRCQNKKGILPKRQLSRKEFCQKLTKIRKELIMIKSRKNNFKLIHHKLVNKLKKINHNKMRTRKIGVKML